MQIIPNKIIAIDFDDTIHDKQNPQPGYKMGPPTAGARSALLQFRELGYEIYIHCHWADSPRSIKTIQDWLLYFDMPFDTISNIKPNAEAFIDNRAVRYENNWDEIISNF